MSRFFGRINIEFKEKDLVGWIVMRTKITDKEREGNAGKYKEYQIRAYDCAFMQSYTIRVVAPLLKFTRNQKVGNTKEVVKPPPPSFPPYLLAA